MKKILLFMVMALILVSTISALQVKEMDGKVITELMLDEVEELNNGEEVYSKEYIDGAIYKFSKNVDIQISTLSRSDRYCTVDLNQNMEMTEERGFWEIIWDFLTFTPQESIVYEGVRHCEIPFEVTDKLNTRNSFDGFNIDVEKLEPYEPTFKYSHDYDAVYDVIDTTTYKMVLDGNGSYYETVDQKSEMKVERRVFKNYKDLTDSSDIDLTKPIGFLIVFNMPLEHNVNYDIKLTGYLDGSQTLSTVNLDPAIGLEGCSGIQNITDDLTATYWLTQDIDCEDTRNWNSGAGFSPIGDHRTGTDPYFTGQFNGQNYTISNLFINNNTDNFGRYGLFGTTNGANISDLGLVNFSVVQSKDGNTAGGLIGHSFNTTISKVYVQGGDVSGWSYAGGLVGWFEESTIEDCYVWNMTIGSAGGVSNAGGLVGYTWNDAVMNRSYVSESEVGATARSGGITSSDTSSSLIQNSFASTWANGSATTASGGIVGDQGGGTIHNSYYNNVSDGRPPTCRESGPDETGCNVIQNNDSYFRGAVTSDAPFDTWDFTAVWRTITSPDNYPLLGLIDSSPTVTLNVPGDAISNLTPVTFNCSATDADLDAALINLTLYIDGTAEVTVTNTTETTSLSLESSQSLTAGNHNWTCLAVDPSNNLGWAAANRTLTIVNFLENSHNFTGIIPEGVEDTYTLNVSADGVSSITAQISYNGTLYSTSKYGSDSEMRFESTLSPTGSGNKNVFWTINYGGTLSNTSVYQQNITDFNLTDCSTGNVVFNFTIENEADKVKIPGADGNVTVEINFNITSLSGTQVENYNSTRSYENSVAVCSDSAFSTTPLILDGLVQYSANDTWIKEFYTIQNFSLKTTTLSNNVTLYLLKTDEAQEFKVTYKDENFLPVKDAVLELQRFYVGDGISRVVERPPFDDDGDTLANFVLGDVLYTLVIKKDNEILATFPNVKAFCENLGTGDCKITLNELTSTTSTADFSTVNGVTFSLSYNRTSRVVSATFNSNDGTTKSMLLNVTLSNMFGNQSLCSDPLTASSGTLSCTVPDSFGNSTAIGNLYADQSLLGRINVNLWQDSEKIYSGSQVTLLIIIFLTIVGIGLSGNALLTLALVAVGFIVNMSIFLINGGGFIGSGSLFLWLIIIIATLLWKANRRQS
jgi:hypothetical protein